MLSSAVVASLCVGGLVPSGRASPQLSCTGRLLGRRKEVPALWADGRRVLLQGQSLKLDPSRVCRSRPRCAALYQWAPPATAQLLRQALAAAEPQAGEEEAPEEGGEMLEFSNPPPLGNCQLLVHAVDARDLAPRDSDNTSDPVVKVLCA